MFLDLSFLGSGITLLGGGIGRRGLGMLGFFIALSSEPYGDSK